MPDAIMFICRMSLLIKHAVKMHCVYMHYAILFIWRMYFCLQEAVKVHCVYMPVSPGEPRRAQENSEEPRRAQERQ